MFWTTAAYAMPGMGATQGGQGLDIMSFAPIIIMFAIFYFLLIRPQQKKAKQQKEMIAALKRGDRVITAGGIHGRILEANEATLLLDLGDSTITINRGYVSAIPQAAVEKKPASSPKKNDKKAKGNRDNEPKAAVAESAPVIEETEATVTETPVENTSNATEEKK